MALRAAAKTPKASAPIEQAPLAVDQRKQSDQRYRLQVDRQTKKSFATIEPAIEAGVTIKRAHPIVQVSIYDAIDCVNQLIGLDGVVGPGPTSRLECPGAVLPEGDCLPARSSVHSSSRRLPSYCRLFPPFCRGRVVKGWTVETVKVTIDLPVYAP